MINIDRVEVFNFEGAFRGLRNPMKSQNKSDSLFGIAKENEYEDICEGYENSFEIHNDEELEKIRNWYWDNGILQYGEHTLEYALLGLQDLKLAQRLIRAGTQDSKFMRQIFVSMDITAPLYYWKQMDQYRIGVVTNSESTMHRLTQTPITRECFSFDEDLDAVDVQDYNIPTGELIPYLSIGSMNDPVIKNCEILRQKYIETKDKRYWRALIQLLPESWNQKRTWSANYQVLRAIYFERRYHRLSEWNEFCRMIEQLPYGKELICYQGDKKNEITKTNN